MSTAQVSNTLSLPGGTPVAGVPVLAELVPNIPAYGTDGDEIVGGAIVATTNGAGLWLAAFERTDTMQPTGLQYRVTELVGQVLPGQQSRVTQIAVAGPGPYTLEQVAQPTPANVVVNPNLFVNPAGGITSGQGSDQLSGAAGFYGPVIIKGGHSFDLAAVGRGDGTTDNLSAWNSVIAQAAACVLVAGGAEVKVQSGEWYMSAAPNPVPSGVEVVGPGAGMGELLLNDVAADGIILGTTTPPVVAAFTPSATMTEGTATLSVPSGTAGAFAAGQYVLLMAQAPYGSFMTMIESVAGSMGAGYTFTLSDYWPFTYPATGATVTVYASLAKNIMFADLGVRVLPLLANSGIPVTMSNPLIAIGADGVLVSAVKVNGSAYYGLHAFQAMNVKSENLRLERCPGGVSFQWVTDGSARDTKLWRSQFGMTATGCPHLRYDGWLAQGDWAGWGSPNPNLANYGRGLKLEQGCHHAKILAGTIDGHSNANRISDSAYGTASQITVLNQGIHGTSGGVFENALQLDGEGTNGAPCLTVGWNIDQLTVRNATSTALLIAGAGGALGVNVDTGHVVRGLVASHVNTAGIGMAVRLGTSNTALIGGSLRDYGTGAKGIYADPLTQRHVVSGFSIQNGASGTAIHTSDSAGNSTVKAGNNTVGEATSYASSDT